MKRFFRDLRGFTLIEILMALAIFSALLVLLLAAFTGAARTRELLSERYSKSRQLAMALDRIGGDFAGAVSSVSLPDTQMMAHEDTFSGQPGGALTLMAFSPASESDDRLSSGLVKIRYYPKVAVEAGYLDLYREQSDLALIENRLPTRESRIARRIKGVRFELFDGTTWQKDWSSSEKKGLLPKRIAVTLIDENGESLRREVPLALSGRESQALFSGNRTKP
ncbi:MAG TPA: type II secretion system protein GspJ [Candidatus Deferrimicrobiaceae bacterium]|jgi:prepilin-type N-terminal cleavage/methylation domain-containing protein